MTRPPDVDRDDSSSLPASPSDRRWARALFLAAFLLNSSVFVFLIADHRLVRDHQARFNYELQYALLGSSSGPWSIPLWMPSGAQGLASNREIVEQAGLLQSVLMPAGALLRGRNFIPLFYLGLWVQETILLVGCWLLARRLFPSPSVAFFVTLSVIGSTVALDNPWVNLHAIYSFPLLVWLLQGYRDDGSRMKLFLGGNLAAMQAMGAPPGIALAAPILALLALAGRRIMLGPSSHPAPGRKRGDALVLLGILACWIPVALCLTAEAEGVVTAAPVSAGFLGDVLAFSGLSNPLRYADLLLGANPSLDWSVYCGSLSVAFAIAATLNAPRRFALTILVALPSALLILGTVLALLVRLAPSLRPASEAPVGTPFVRIFVAFLAGAGYQQALLTPMRTAILTSGRALLASSVLLVALSWGAALHADPTRDLVATLTAGEPERSCASPVLQPWRFPSEGGASVPSDLYGASALSMGLAGALMLAWGLRPRARSLVLALIPFLHSTDVLNWKFRMSWLKTYPANPTQQAMQDLAPETFPSRRFLRLEETPRFAAFHRAAPGQRHPRYAPRGPGAGAAAACWDANLAENPATVDRWMEPWGRLTEALRSSGSPLWSGKVPAKLSGVSTGTIQFFKSAHPLPDEQVALRISRAEYEGDLLWIEGADAGDEVSLGANDRIVLPYQVLSFSPTSVDVSVNAPPEGAWMMLANVWSPRWRATVNRAPRPVAKANMAYQAVRLDPGQNRVELRYHSPVRSTAFGLVSLNSLFWLATALGMVWRLLRRGDLA